MRIGILVWVAACASAELNVTVLKEVAGRFLPDQLVAHLSFVGVDDTTDTFLVMDGPNGTVSIEASSTVAAASGLNWYLRYRLNCSLSWSGAQCDAEKLETVGEAHRATRKTAYSYYQNVCTFDYSMVWWDEKRWTQEIDWMALQGINMPLAFVGQEAVWEKTFEKFGVPSNVTRSEYFAGPAFLVWQRMGNMRGWGGPLPELWIRRRVELQKHILARMLAFGMQPALPGFAGHVPRALTTLYNASFVPSPSWGGFEDEYTDVELLSPSDDASMQLFIDIGAEFLKQQREIYDDASRLHVYQCDTWNEMSPPASLDLSRSSGAVIGAMRSVDPKAVWLMQGWLFQDATFWTEGNIQSYLSGAPDDAVMILDLYADVNPVWSRTQGFYGKPFLWNTLHNFGGDLGMYGNLEVVANASIAVADGFDNCVGFGLTMEGIEQNDVVYERANDMVWEENPLSFDQVAAWALDRVDWRYGPTSARDLARRAWNETLYLMYRDRTNSLAISLMVLRPSLSIDATAPYDAARFVPAWRSLMLAGLQDPALAKRETYGSDLADWTREALANLFRQTYARFVADEDGAGEAALLLATIRAADRIMSSTNHTLLGPWIQSARDWARGDDALTQQYDFNARRLITLWGDKSASAVLTDYASRQWGGMLRDYYAPRWQLFLDDVLQARRANATFNQSAFVDRLYDAVEDPFSSDAPKTNPFPLQASGDTLAIALEIFHEFEAFWP